MIRLTGLGGVASNPGKSTDRGGATQSRPCVTLCTVADATTAAQPRARTGLSDDHATRARTRSAGPGHPDGPPRAPRPGFHGHGVRQAAHERQRDGLLLALTEPRFVSHDDVERGPLVVEFHEDVAGLPRLQRTTHRARAHLAHREPDLVEADLVHPGATGHGNGDEPRGADMLRCGLEPQVDGHEWRSTDLGVGAQLAVPSGTPLVSS